MIDATYRPFALRLVSFSLARCSCTIEGNVNESVISIKGLHLCARKCKKKKCTQVLQSAIVLAKRGRKALVKRERDASGSPIPRVDSR